MKDFLEMLLNWFLSLFGKDGRPTDSFFKGSMFFPKQNGTGVDASLGYASIDVPEPDAHIEYTLDAIARNGGDAVVYIAEKLFNNPDLQAKLTGDDSELVKQARKKGVNRWIVSIKNDNHVFPFANVEALIQQVAKCYEWASPDEMCFLVCLEADEIMGVAQVKQMIGWCKKYAPDKRVLVGSSSVSFLRAFKGTGAELWLETAHHPFQLNKQNAESYIANLNGLKAYGPVWAGEYGVGSGEAAEYVTKRAREIGCVGIGSYVGG